MVHTSWLCQSLSCSVIADGDVPQLLCTRSFTRMTVICAYIHPVSPSASASAVYILCSSVRLERPAVGRHQLPQCSTHAFYSPPIRFSTRASAQRLHTRAPLGGFHRVCGTLLVPLHRQKCMAGQTVRQHQWLHRGRWVLSDSPTLRRWGGTNSAAGQQTPSFWVRAGG
jgi:hypothetical protein